MDTRKTIDACYLAALSIDLETRCRQYLTPASYNISGVRTSQTTLFLLCKAAYHNGPNNASISRVSNQVIDSAIQHPGDSDLTPRSALTRFAVIADQQQLLISSVLRKDIITTRIELAEALPADIRLHDLLDAHPGTSNPVRENTTLRPPLKPFVLQTE